MATPEELEQAITDNAMAPSEASVDGQMVRQHALRDQIDVDRYLASKRASQRRGLPLSRTKLSPPGGTGC